jgi:hypothetical protein
MEMFKYKCGMFCLALFVERSSLIGFVDALKQEESHQNPRAVSSQNSCTERHHCLTASAGYINLGVFCWFNVLLQVNGTVT